MFIGERDLGRKRNKYGEHLREKSCLLGVEKISFVLRSFNACRVNPGEGESSQKRRLFSAARYY